MENNLKKLIVELDFTLTDVINQIEKNKEGFVVVLNKNKTINGIATDGDIRRYLIKGGDLSDKIEKCCNKNFISVSEGLSHENIYKMLDDEIKLIPIINSRNELIEIITKKRIPVRQENKIYYRAKSPVRISFGGGGSDTTSYFKNNPGAVLNATISLYTHCSLLTRNDKRIIIDSYDLGIKKEFIDLNNLIKNSAEFKLIASVISVINPNFGFELFIQSDFPNSSGLGGSSAVLSSIIGCFNEMRKDKWSSYEIAEIAYEAERLNLGIDGGWQDQYASVFGGFNFMEFTKKKNTIIPIRLQKNLLHELEESLILCYTKTDHGKIDIHNNQKANTKNENIIKNINENVKLAFEIRDSILKGDFKRFCLCLNKSWDLKKTFSDHISNDSLNKIYNAAIDNGALAGKLLGAGGGGYFLFFVKANKRNNLINWMKKNQLEYTNFRFENDGLKSWSFRKN
jgi:D-glycero-alpha-D-manno-heptose-7-phosphate kinase